MTDGEDSNSLALTKLDALVKTYYGETSVKTKETVFIWTIKNASQCWMVTKEGEYCDSPDYRVNLNKNSTHWNLRYFPNGSSVEPWVSLQLCEHICIDKPMKLRVKISIIDTLDRERVQYENFISLGNNIEVLDLDKFIRKNDIPNFLRDGNLKIICRLYSDVTFDSTAPITPNLCDSMRNKQAPNDLDAGFSDFEELLESSEFSDVKLVTNSQEFSAHKAILSARSRVFEDLFSRDVKESTNEIVTITDLDGEVVREMLRFIYAGTVGNLKAMSEKLFIAADKYQVKRLKEICESTMIQSLSNKTIGDILILVDHYSTEKLRDSAIEFITMHANELSSDDNFHATITILSPSLLALLIKALMLRA